MSNYTKATNFAAKDALPSGNTNKIIKGTEIDTEFNAIVAAVASKADTNSPTFTGTPLAPTAAGGTNTTQLATTAFVKAAVDAVLGSVYPVGSIYINAASTTNPGTLLGFGTWVEFGSGRVLVGQNTSDSSFNTLEETGGSKDAIAVAHTHTATSTVTDPGHSHSLQSYNDNTTQGSRPRGTNNTTVQGTSADPVLSATTGITVSTSIASAGSSGTNANLQPYIVVKMWKRTA